MASGTELFARLGFEGTRVDLIARRARVNKAMISYHFGGKAGLYRAILHSVFTSTLERIQPLRVSREPADRLLRSFVRQFSDMVAGNPGLPVMLLREALSGGRHLDRETLPLFAAVFSVLREIIEKGIQEGTFRPVDPLLTHLSLIGSIVFFFATTPMRDRMISEGHIPVRPPGADEYILHVQDLMSRALAAQPPPGTSAEKETT